MKKALALVLTLVLLCGAQVGSIATAESNGPIIAFLHQTMAFARYPEADRPGFEAQCKELGYTPLMQCADDNSETQVQQAENAITMGAVALVLQPCSNAAAATIVDMAHEAGVIVIGYNDLVDQVELDGFVGRDVYDMWSRAAIQFCDAYPTGNYILANGDESYMVARQAQPTYSEVVAKYAGITVVSDQWNTAWSSETAMKQVEAALAANNDDIAGIICANDAIATGAMQALEAVGLLGKVGVVGCDVEPACAKAIAKGDMFGSCWTECSTMGKDAVIIADALVKGEALPENATTYNNGYEFPFIPTEAYLVTADNMDEFLATHEWWLTANDVYSE